MYKKILIVGSPGAGKTTFAKKLSSATGIKRYSLDDYYWKPGWVAENNVVWNQKLRTMLSKAQWIVDGSYLSSLKIRLSYADVLIYIDIHPLRCFYRALKREIYRYKGCREDLPAQLCAAGDSINFNEFIKLINLIFSYRILYKGMILDLCRQLNVKILIAKNPLDLYKILASFN